MSKFLFETRPKTKAKSRVSQIVSLTGFSFVGGPAMNDSAAASEFLHKLNLPYRSAVSLDTQTIEAWADSQTGLNPCRRECRSRFPRSTARPSRSSTAVFPRVARNLLLSKIAAAIRAPFEVAGTIADGAPRDQARDRSVLLSAKQGEHRHRR